MDEYECNDISDEPNHSEGIVSEECWKETYKGDSRKWLLKDGHTKNSQSGQKSTMKETYPYPRLEQKTNVGERRVKIMEKLYNEAAQEIIRERQEPPVEKYCTEYDGNYNNAELIKSVGNDEEEKKKLFEKYPLYTSPAMSYWNFRIEKYQRGRTFFPGLTHSLDLKSPFKRCNGFTKPISEVLDDCQL